MISYYPIFVSVRSSAYAFQIKGSTSSLNRCGSTFHSPSVIPFEGRLGELSAPWRKANDSVTNADNESARGVHFSHVGTTVLRSLYRLLHMHNLPWVNSILEECSTIVFSHHQEEFTRKKSRFFLHNQRQRPKYFVARKFSVAQVNGSDGVLSFLG